MWQLRTIGFRLSGPSIALCPHAPGRIPAGERAA
ncbi:hypothetical protein Ga0074812_10370 [Parafrankia irregularis]|uniref:Uncharacterized protein n=1 Tax=Parafrankia irregularis TaxID=795642 RepID=A0A0S4QGF3_9ACTN|nr:hypothetical protein Ga0074812_10370 [Parafrankia irregularis]